MKCCFCGPVPVDTAWVHTVYLKRCNFRSMCFDPAAPIFIKQLANPRTMHLFRGHFWRAHSGGPRKGLVGGPTKGLIGKIFWIDGLVIWILYENYTFCRKTLENHRKITIFRLCFGWGCFCFAENSYGN